MLQVSLNQNSQLDEAKLTVQGTGTQQRATDMGVGSARA